MHHKWVCVLGGAQQAAADSLACRLCWLVWLHPAAQLYSTMLYRLPGDHCFERGLHHCCTCSPDEAIPGRRQA